MSEAWRVCSQCKSGIDHGAQYWICGVSTCNRKRSGLFFCSMDCWDAHLPMARHREAWAEELVAPTREQAEAEAEAAAAGPALGTSPTSSSAASPGRSKSAPEGGPTRRRVVPSRRRDPELPQDILVVASKLKNYIRAASGLNTSGAVMEVLSEKLRDLCDDAIDRAKEAGRTTVMDRDF